MSCPRGRAKYARNASMAVLVGRAGRGQRNREEIGAEATDKPAVPAEQPYFLAPRVFATNSSAPPR